MRSSREQRRWPSTRTTTSEISPARHSTRLTSSENRKGATATCSTICSAVEISNAIAQTRMNREERLAQALGAEVTASAPMPVGFGLTGLRVTLADGRILAVKARQGASHADLRLEGYMLGELAR